MDSFDLESASVPTCEVNSLVSNTKQTIYTAKIMVLMTMIARVADGLPLAASIQEDEQVCVC